MKRVGVKEEAEGGGGGGTAHGCSALCMVWLRSVRVASTFTFERTFLRIRARFLGRALSNTPIVNTPHTIRHDTAHRPTNFSDNLSAQSQMTKLISHRVAQGF